MADFIAFTGHGYVAFMPKLNAHWFGCFITQVADCLPSKSLLVAYGAKAYKADLFDKTKLTFRKSPSYGPELNPVECAFKFVRQQLKHRIFSILTED